MRRTLVLAALVAGLLAAPAPAQAADGFGPTAIPGCYVFVRPNRTNRAVLVEYHVRRLGWTPRGAQPTVAWYSPGCPRVAR